MSCCCRDQFVPSTYTEGRKLILLIQDILNGFAHATDDPINHVHNAVRGHLVSVDDPCTVHGHDLRSEEQNRSLHRTSLRSGSIILIFLCENRPHLSSG